MRTIVLFVRQHHRCNGEVKARGCATWCRQSAPRWSFLPARSSWCYAAEGTSRSKVSSLIQRNGGFPSTAADAIDGILPDSEKRTEATQYVKDRLGSFSMLVDGTPQFPCGLRARQNPLPVFYYRGDINLADSRCISAVGTRHPSERGRLAAARIASALVRHGFTVVDGLATGIDTVVAKTALEAEGRIIGVIGTPIDIILRSMRTCRNWWLRSIS